MPGEPAETMIGVGAIGFGALMLFCAVKNVSPVALIRQAVTTGQISLDGLPLLYNSGSDSQLATTVPGTVRSAIDKIGTKNPSLANDIRTECGNLAQAITNGQPKSYADTKHVFDLLSQARSLGFSVEVDTIESWINSLKYASSPSSGNGGVTI